MTQMSLVHEPVALHPKNLPSSLKPLVDSQFSAFMQEQSTDSSLDFIKKLDNHWGTKIYDVMPEWKETYESNIQDSQIEKDYDLYRRTLEYVKKIR